MSLSEITQGVQGLNFKDEATPPQSDQVPSSTALVPFGRRVTVETPGKKATTEGVATSELSRIKTKFGPLGERLTELLFTFSLNIVDVVAAYARFTQEDLNLEEGFSVVFEPRIGLKVLKVSPELASRVSYMGPCLEDMNFSTPLTTINQRAKGRKIFELGDQDLQEFIAHLPNLKRLKIDLTESTAFDLKQLPKLTSLEVQSSEVFGSKNVEAFAKEMTHLENLTLRFPYPEPILTRVHLFENLQEFAIYDDLLDEKRLNSLIASLQKMMHLKKVHVKVASSLEWLRSCPFSQLSLDEISIQDYQHKIEFTPNPALRKLIFIDCPQATAAVCSSLSTPTLQVESVESELAKEIRSKLQAIAESYQVFQLRKIKI